MHSMGWKNGVVGLVVALAALAGATPASATPAFLPAGAAFPATSTGEHVFAINANLKWRCNHVQWSGATASPAGDTVALSATYGAAPGAAGAWCRLYVGGVFSASTVTTSGWSMTVSSYNALTGASAGTLTMGGGMTITTGGCIVSVVSGSVLPFTAQNVTPVGLQLVASASGIHFTSSGCGGFGVPSSGGSFSYAGGADATGPYVN